MITRDTVEAEAISHRVGIMNDGKMLAIGSISEILQNHGGRSTSKKNQEIHQYTIEIQASMYKIENQNLKFS